MLLHVVCTQEVEIQYYTAVRTHVRVCTYQVHVTSYILCHKKPVTAVVVLQLRAVSASASLTLYTSVRTVVCCYSWTQTAYSRSTCVVLVLGTGMAACAAAAACYNARGYCRILLAALLVATVYCFLCVCEYGYLLLAIHIPERLAAARYLFWYLWSFLMKYKTCQET